MRHLLLICLMLGMTGCREKESPTVVLVFPDDFRGVAILRWKQPDGIKLTPGELNYELHIPKSGVLSIQGKNLMVDWYRQEARYESGKPLVQGDQHTKDEEGIYLWDMGVNADGSECWYVVGQIKDLDGVLERKLGMPPLKNPPRGKDKPLPPEPNTK